ncbi:hypothetical protein [Saccharopolyspora flava]
MRSRDRVALGVLRSALAAVDNAEAVPADDHQLRGVAVEEASVGAGTTEVARRELGEAEVAEVVRREADERIDAASRLTAEHTARADQLRAESQVLLNLLER